MEKQGLFTKKTVGKGVFIFTRNGNFILSKFWGLYEQNETPVGVVILADRNLLVALEGSKKSLILLDWEKELTGKKYESWDEARTDANGMKATLDLASLGSPAAQFCLDYACGQIGKGQWYLETADDAQLKFDHKKELDIALSIAGGNAIEADDWHWTCTRRYDKSNWVLYWGNGLRNYYDQNYIDRVRPVSAFSLENL